MNWLAMLQIVSYVQLSFSKKIATMMDLDKKAFQHSSPTGQPYILQ